MKQYNVFNGFNNALPFIRVSSLPWLKSAMTFYNATHYVFFSKSGPYKMPITYCVTRKMVFKHSNIFFKCNQRNYSNSKSSNLSNPVCSATTGYEWYFNQQQTSFPSIFLYWTHVKILLFQLIYIKKLHYVFLSQ